MVRIDGPMADEELAVVFAAVALALRAKGLRPVALPQVRRVAGPNGPALWAFAGRLAQMAGRGATPTRSRR